MQGQLWQWDAADLAQAIRTRAISAREAVSAALDRLAAVNPRINAVVETLGDEALAAAGEADEQVRRGEPLGPLHGVPVTVKVNTDQRGHATTNGIVAFREVIAPDDAPVAANLKKVGAIIIGRTNTPAFSWRWFTDNDLHGATLNPWNSAITPGGSSGGAAAALAAGIGALAHGNDIGGSIRYPAYACGLVGIRPSFGRVPSFNPSAPEERPLSAQIMSVQGPLARRVRDLRLGLAAMAQFDPRDPWWAPAPLQGLPVKRPIRVAMSAGPGRLGAWMLFFEEYPLVVMPVSCEPPFPAGYDQGDDDTLDRLVTAQRPQFPPACLGLPGISVPTGIVEGLPMGVQLIAGRFREDLLLDAAEIIEARAPMPTPLEPRP